MSAASRERLGTVLVVLLGLYLVYRAWEVVQIVQRPIPPAAEAEVAGAEGPVSRALRSDETLAALAPDLRDPMHSKPAPRRPITRRAPPEPRPETPPALRMVLVDRVNPVIQISVQGTLSDRLGVGDSFRGWTVEEITSASAVVSKDNERVSISLRRAQ